MRLTALLGCAVLIAGCTKKEAPPAADTTAIAPPAEPPAMSLGHVAGIWNVTVKPEGKDTVVTTYILNTTDTTGWLFAFPKGKPIPLKVVEVVGDTVVTATDWFDSSVRPGLKARNTGRAWLNDDGKLVGKVTARYQTTGPDTVRVFDTEGVRK